MGVILDFPGGVQRDVDPPRPQLLPSAAAMQRRLDGERSAESDVERREALRCELDREDAEGLSAVRAIAVGVLITMLGLVTILALAVALASFSAPVPIDCASTTSCPVAP